MKYSTTAQNNDATDHKHAETQKPLRSQRNVENSQ